MFYGNMVALVTPMLGSGEVDWHRLETLVEWHIERGTTAIIACGSTGEAATLTDEEQRQVIRSVVKAVAGRVPVIAGTGTHSTSKTIQATQAALSEGVDACLVVTPYYNKPTQEGLFLHFDAVAKSVPLPIILYNVPGRTGVDLLPETVYRLSKITNVVGIKEATGDVQRGKVIHQQCGSSMDIYSGDDATAHQLFLEAGAKGTISVTANVTPDLMSKWYQALKADQIDLASQMNQQLMGLHQALFCESNPIPVKWAMTQMGLIAEGIRLPLTPLSESHQAKLFEVLNSLGLLG